MIEGIEPIYQLIADSIQRTIPDSWATAWVEAIYFTEHISYSAEYTPSNGSAPKSFATERSGRRAFEQLREMFQNAGKPLWCGARFTIHSDGTFNMKWNYENCDGNGFARFDEKEEFERKWKLWNQD